MPVSAKSEAAHHPEPVATEPDSLVVEEAPAKGKVRLRTVGFPPYAFRMLGPVINPTKDDPNPERAEFIVEAEGSDFDADDAEVILAAAARDRNAHVEKVDA